MAIENRRKMRLDSLAARGAAGGGVLARPTGVGSALTVYDMPIEGRDELLAAAARHLA
jgi:hypothetical protein